jgi:hypothetical protein
VAAFSAAATLAAGAVTVLTAPISATVLAAAALAGVIAVALEEFGLLDGVLNAIANPIDSFGRAVIDVTRGVGDLLQDVGLLSQLLKLLGDRAANAETKIDSLTQTVLTGLLPNIVSARVDVSQLEAGNASGGSNGSGSDTSVLPNQPNTPTVVNNNDITVNGASDPAQTRESVRRAVEEANRQQRNVEDGRVD